jgi:hypothetical protein
LKIEEMSRLFLAKWKLVPAGRMACLLGLLILSAILLWRAGSFLAYVHAVLFYPYQLDYGEGIVWQQMRDMVRGAAYAPLGVYPAIVYHYPPIFHLTSAGLAALVGMDQLAAGRLVSIISSFSTAYMVALLTVRATPRDVDPLVRNGAAFLAGLLFLNCHPVIMWSALMRVDMLAGALAMAGIVFSLRAMDRPFWIYTASLMFVLSVYTKQISIAAPLSAYSVLLFLRPKVAIRGIIFAIALGFLALAWLVWATSGGFLIHIFLYNINRLTPEILTDVLLMQMLGHAVFLTLGLLGVAASWREIGKTVAGSKTLASIRQSISQSPPSVAALMLIIFVALKTVMLLGMMKSGSSYNYMIEWLSGVAIFAGLALMPVIGFAFGRHGGPAHWPLASMCLVLVGLPVQMLLLPLHFADQQLAERSAASRAPIVRRIVESERPVISDDMTLLIRAGKDVKWEAAITAELGQTGVYDQAAFARLVRAHCFGFFVTEGTIGTMPFIVRYNPPVAAAIAQAYPKEEMVSKFILHVPPIGEDGRHCPLNHKS